MAERRGVLVMAYGTPRTLDDVEAYYTDIRRGRPPSAARLEELTARYRAIGGSPLYEITRAQAEGIGARLGLPAYVGLKHAPPTIPDALGRMAGDGIDRAVGIVLAPHYSKMSIGDYSARARRAGRELGWPGRLTVVPSWHLEPGYIEFLAGALKRALDRLSERGLSGAVVMFSAHSLPARILQAADPYPSQLEATARAAAEGAGIERWRIAWQSAGRTAEQWLGPDILEVLDDLAGAGVPGVVVCPCGFVADHLEVLYDIDIEACARAHELGIELGRTEMPNTDPGFLDTLAGVVGRAFSEA